MGGAPRIIRKVVSPIKKVVRPPSSPIAERRVEVAKKTDAVEKKVAPRKLKRRSRRRTQLMATSDNTGLATGADYSPIRNPRDGGSKLGSA
jgi:hypothetical protein